MEFIVHDIIADIPTQNGRIYSTEALQEAIEDYNSRGPKLMTMGEPEFGEYTPIDMCTVDMAKAVGVIEDVELGDDGKVRGKVDILDTPQGTIVHELLTDQTCSVGMSCVGTLTKIETDDGDDITVVEDVHLVSISKIVNFFAH
jgi:hypothetical protein